MSERPTPETDADNDTQCELAAWELLREARRERDELRAELESEKIARNLIIAKGLKVERERDEARELCRELTDLVAYGLGQSSEEWSLDAMRQATDAIQKVKQMGTLPTD
jgi:hypothetical protein